MGPPLSVLATYRHPSPPRLHPPPRAAAAAAAMPPSFSRLSQEMRELSRGDGKASEGVELAPNENSIFHWEATLLGPEGTGYEGGLFRLDIQVPEEYPLAPPNVRFRTRVFHPNVHFKTGEVCLDILKQHWSPAWTLQSVCQAVLALLSSPEPDSPLNCDAGNLLRCGDERGYRSLARMYTIEFASTR